MPGAFIGYAPKAVKNFLTDADLSTYDGKEADGRAITLSSGKAVLATAPGAGVLGSLVQGRDGSGTTATVSVATDGPAYFRLGGTVAQGDALEPGASGLWVAAADGQGSAIALEAGVSGDLIGGEFAALGGIRIAETTIAAGSVATLNATAVSLVAAPGAGKYLDLVDAEVFLDYGTAGYDAVAATDYLSIRYTNASGAVLTANTSPVGFGDATADAHFKMEPTSHLITLNAALVAHIQGGEWYSAAGDSPLTFRVKYRVATAQS
jgi:hypothetical protein